MNSPPGKTQPAIGIVRPRVDGQQHSIAVTNALFAFGVTQHCLSSNRNVQRVRPLGGSDDKSESSKSFRKWLKRATSFVLGHRRSHRNRRGTRLGKVGGFRCACPRFVALRLCAPIAVSPRTPRLQETVIFKGFLVGARGFEPRTCSTQNCRATRLRYTPIWPMVDTRSRRPQQGSRRAPYSSKASRSSRQPPGLLQYWWEDSPD